MKDGIFGREEWTLSDLWRILRGTWRVGFERWKGKPRYEMFYDDFMWELIVFHFGDLWIEVELRPY